MDNKLVRQQMDIFMENLNKCYHTSVSVNIANLVPVKYKLEAIYSDSRTDSGKDKVLMGCFKNETELRNLIKRAVNTIVNPISLRIMNTELGYTINFPFPENNPSVIDKVGIDTFEELITYEDRVSKMLDAELVKTESVVNFIKEAVDKDLVYISSSLQLVPINRKSLSYKDDKVYIDGNIVFDLTNSNITKKAEYFFNATEEKYYYVTNQSFIDKVNIFK